jgi:hypothetical protein
MVEKLKIGRETAFKMPVYPIIDGILPAQNFATRKLSS